MPIYVKDMHISPLNLGATDIQRVYVGDSLVYVDVDEVSGLTAHWKLNGDFSESVSGMDLSPDGSLGEWTGGLVGGSYRLRPQEAEVNERGWNNRASSDELSLREALAGTQPHNISFWLYREEEDTPQVVLFSMTDASVSSGPAQGLRIIYTGPSGSGISYQRATAAGTSDSIMFSPTIGYNQWIFLSINYTGSSPQIYVNAVDTSLSFFGQDPDLSLGAPGDYTHTTIGGMKTTLSPGFLGKLDEVRIFNRALTPEEITYYYNNGIGR
jgi:hypothetical protein